MEPSDHESSGTIKNGEKLKSPQTPQDDHLMENHSISSTEKQLTISSLTFEMIQSRSGKSMGSMNLDEFLNSVWNACDDVNRDDKEPVSYEQTPFSGKTNGEVLAESQPMNDNLGNDHGDHEQNHHGHYFVNNDQTLVQGDQQQSPGVMTFEQFLITTGVLKETSLPSAVPMEQADHGELEDLNSNPPPQAGNFSTNCGCLDMNIGIGQLMPPTNPTANGVDDGNNVEHNLGGEPPRGNKNRKRKRGNGKPVIVSMEEAIVKRQRRMIRNRESAQRSWARKQAYIAELRLELNRIRKEIELLELALRIENEFPAKKEFRALRRTMSF